MSSTAWTIQSQFCSRMSCDCVTLMSSLTRDDQWPGLYHRPQSDSPTIYNRQQTLDGRYCRHTLASMDCINMIITCPRLPLMWTQTLYEFQNMKGIGRKHWSMGEQPASATHNTVTRRGHEANWSTLTNCCSADWLCYTTSQDTLLPLDTDRFVSVNAVRIVFSFRIELNSYRKSQKSLVVSTC